MDDQHWTKSLDYHFTSAKKQKDFFNSKKAYSPLKSGICNTDNTKTSPFMLKGQEPTDSSH